MGKRGQVAVFVALGILVLAAVGFLVYFISIQNKGVRTEITATQSDVDSTRREVESLVQLCFEDTINRGIINAAEHGGYAALENLNYRGIPEDAMIEPTPLREIITYIYPCPKGDPRSWIEMSLFDYCKHIPTRDDVKGTLVNYAREIMPTCTETEFNKLRNNGWEIEGTEFDVIVDPSANVGTFFTLNIPRRFSKDDQSFVINEFNYKSDVDFLEIFGLVDGLAGAIEAQLRIGGQNNPLFAGLASDLRRLAYDGQEGIISNQGYEFISAASYTGNDFFAFKKEEFVFIFAFHVADLGQVCQGLGAFINQFGTIELQNFCNSVQTT